MKQIARSLTRNIYARVAKPILFRFAPDDVHEWLIRTGAFSQKLGFIAPLLRASWAHTSTRRLTQTVFGMRFSNPVGLSAGLDKNAAIVPVIRAVGFGFTTVGSISSQPAKGNARPWFHRLPNTKSLVVNAGLPNHGANAINSRIKCYNPRIFKDFPLIASVAKTNSPDTCTDEAGIEDYIEGVKKLRNNPNIAMFELNISCPNAFGGEPFSRKEPLEMLLTKIDAMQLTQPVTIKLPIDKPWSELTMLLEVIVQHNVAGVTIGNLQKNRATVELKDELPDDMAGNLSGKPCTEQSNALISQAYSSYGDRLTIIGVGGIFSAEDAYKKIRLGASLVELITGVIFTGPQLIGQINYDLAKLLARDGFANVNEAVGVDVRSR